MVSYFKNQRDLAQALNEVIDAYWADRLTEKELSAKIEEFIEKNPEKMFINNDFTGVIKQRLGKKRIELLTKIHKR